MKTVDQIVAENNRIAKDVREFFEWYEKKRKDWGFDEFKRSEAFELQAVIRRYTKKNG